jgi:hypothetical protein
MKISHRVKAFLAIAAGLFSQLHAQPATAPHTYQILNYVKVPPASRTEFIKLLQDATMKTAETRIKAGEMVSWTLLKAVMPTGSEARADYLISTIYEGVPPEPLDHAGLDALLKRSGVQMSATEFYAARDRLSALAMTEMWQPDVRIGTLKKGNYISINHMNAKDGDAYVKFEQTVWRPIAEQLIKSGTLSGWMVASRAWPAGDSMPYNHYSVDMFPTWAAALGDWSIRDAFAKAHPGKNLDETLANVSTLRSLVSRELWYVSERIAK